MPSFIRPTYKIVMEEFSSWRPCLGCFHSSRRSSPTADIKDRNLRKRLQKFCRISTLKSSNAPIGSAGLWSCPNAGSSSAPSHGSIAADGSPRIGRTSTERRSCSCASHQSASCSENSAIRPEVSGQTLRAGKAWGRDLEGDLVHECTHAGFDVDKRNTLTALNDEAAAYVAEVLYYRMSSAPLSYWAGMVGGVRDVALPVANALLHEYQAGNTPTPAVDPVTFNALRAVIPLRPVYRGTVVTNGGSYIRNG